MKQTGNEVAPLTVYKASAGSGKTFTLTTEYIKMLIANPTSYRSILAVTFTNKATEEMKARILSQLYGIWKQLPTSANYLNKVCADMDISPNLAAQRAGMALTQLIHHYSYFRIQTIDTFFQTILRNLARELDLTANFRVDLNDIMVEEQAVDELVENLTSSDAVLAWILDFIRSNIDDDKGWNVIGTIKRFGHNIYKDYYKDHQDIMAKRFAQEGFFDHYSDLMRKIRFNAIRSVQQSVEQFFALLTEHGIDESEIKANTLSYFQKQREQILPTAKLTKTHQKALTASGEWIKKATRKSDQPRHDQLEAVVENVLMPFYQATEKKRKKEWNRYVVSSLILDNLHKLRLLGAIDKKVRESNTDNNRFLLSDTQYLLHSLISENDTPFVFEKAGTQLTHIMIDEFQDTSVVQWKNFKVLLDECLSKTGAGTNLIVGDVKQSIYRWREGDWQLLNNIEQQFSPAQSKLKVVSLATNYRSQRNIVVFNNAFFKVATQIEAEKIAEYSKTDAAQIQQAYADVAQEVPESRDNCGRVEISIVPKTRQEDNSYDADQYMMQRVEAILRNLLTQGVKMQDIAILSRTNDNIQQMAEYLAVNMPEVHVISKEAYRLDSSIAVNAIIWVLRYLIHPNDEVVKANIASFYLEHVNSEALPKGKLLTLETITLIVDKALNVGTDLSSLPLYDIAEHIQRAFKLNTIKGQSAFLCSFFDKINAFTIDHPSDIEGFINEWDNHLFKQAIYIDGEDGIRMLTIHTSKGLEFDHVIFPFCNWDMKVKGDIWCSPKEEPFNQLPIIPVPFSKDKCFGTDFEPDMEEENFQNTVDHLNLLYVAFTRASRNLFVIGKEGSELSRSRLLETALPMVADTLEGATLIEPNDDEKEGVLSFAYGTLSLPERTETSKAITQNDKRRQDENVFNMNMERIQLQFNTFKSKAEFRQSNDSREFVMNNDEQQQHAYIKTGNLLHSLFSNIRTSSDIDRVLTEYEERGLLTSTDISREHLQKMIDKRMQHPLVSQWFAEGWTLFNECTILSRNPNTGAMEEHRPDRVMMRNDHWVVLDFKFGTPKPEHRQQVAHYMSLLEAMGNNDVQGYLWYFYSNNIEEVKR